MKVSKRKIRILLVLCAVFVALNLYQVGQVMSGHYEWICADCKVGLYHCPFKNITHLTVPATYEVHPHRWIPEGTPPSWSPWKPWQWYVYLTTDANLLKKPDPQTLFQSAPPETKYSEEAGLRKLASDPHYRRANEIKDWFSDAQSQPE